MEEQDQLLEAATGVVREQSFFMKKAIEQENLRDALKYSSNMICELRTSQLSPRFYYELYMLNFQELQHLSLFFGDKSRHGRKLAELYESVQHAGNILPRLYLLVTVGVAYIQSKEVSGSEILRDMAELCKGVQHPIRGLFLRYYLLQMTKDKLQQVASDESLDEVVDFILNNFSETTRLWIRLQNAGTAGQRDRVKRDRERHDLRILVGASLVRLSQLDGMTRSFYTDKVLPRILDQVIACKDPMAQQYLLDCTVQVFPDDFHLASLSVLLSTCSQTQKSVDLRPVLINLMNRLRTFLMNNKMETPPDVFGLFRTHLEKIMHRTADASNISDPSSQSDESTAVIPITNASSVDSPQTLAAKACSNMLELFQAFLGFTLSLDPKRFDQLSIVHGMALAALDKYMEAIAGLPQSAEDRAADEDDEPVWLGPLIEIIETTVSTVPLSTSLALSQFGSLLSAIPKKYNRRISVCLIDAILADDETRSMETRQVADPATLTRFMGLIESLLYDSADCPPMEESTFESEQVRVCKMIHFFYSDDTDIHYELLNTLRSYFGRGGPKRLCFTLPTILSCSQKLVQRVHERETTPKFSVKKVFQFIHNTCTALNSVSPETAFRHWLSAGRIADMMDASLEPIAVEFFTQALIIFEEELTDAKSQVNGITGLVSALIGTRNLAPNNYEAIATKTAQHAARLLKKADQCRAVLACSHLFWSNSITDSKRVVECLQRSLKIADLCVQSSPTTSHDLFVDCLNKYLYYFENGTEDISPAQLTNLIALCREHATYAATNPGIEPVASNPFGYLDQTVSYIKEKRASEEGSKLVLIKLMDKENVSPPVVDDL
jgi:vacuolar protein sorting-associated protein 35